MNQTISIIIPAYNEENYIRKTLHSLQLQTFQDFEIVVVANGCTDGTEEVVRTRVHQGGKVRLHSLPRAQVSVARNYGAQEARGEVLVFLDADTQLDADALQRINLIFSSGMNGSGRNSFDTNSRGEDVKQRRYSVGTTRVRPDVATLQYRFLLWVKNVFIRSGLYKGCSGVLICRREDFMQVGGYDEWLAVREQRKLILLLLNVGGYVCVPVMATTSMRRFERWGFGKIFWFWVGKWLQDKFGDLHQGVYEKVR